MDRSVGVAEGNGVLTGAGVLVGSTGNTDGSSSERLVKNRLFRRTSLSSVSVIVEYTRSSSESEDTVAAIEMTSVEGA